MCSTLGLAQSWPYITTNIRLGWEGMPGTNTLSYYGPKMFYGILAWLKVRYYNFCQKLLKVLPTLAVYLVCG